MISLPENKPHTPKGTPRYFFIWGATMSGKSYLSERFPNTLVLNTDDNAEMGTRPYFLIENRKGADGKLKQTAAQMLGEIITALGSQKNSYETVVVDTIDDICLMFEQGICLENDVESLGDIPYGKGFALFNSILQSFVMDLKGLHMNIVYISREVESNDENSTEMKPSLKVKYYNIVNGNCDLVIRTQRIGTKYFRSVTDRRRKYKASEIDDPKILRIMKNVVGALEPETKPMEKDGKTA